MVQTPLAKHPVLAPCDVTKGRDHMQDSGKDISQVFA